MYRYLFSTILFCAQLGRFLSSWHLSVSLLRPPCLPGEFMGKSGLSPKCRLARHLLLCVLPNISHTRLWVFMASAIQAFLFYIHIRCLYNTFSTMVHIFSSNLQLFGKLFYLNFGSLCISTSINFF